MESAETERDQRLDDVARSAAALRERSGYVGDPRHHRTGAAWGEARARRPEFGAQADPSRLRSGLVLALVGAVAGAALASPEPLRLAAYGLLLVGSSLLSLVLRPGEAITAGGTKAWNRSGRRRSCAPAAQGILALLGAAVIVFTSGAVHIGEFWLLLLLFGAWVSASAWRTYGLYWAGDLRLALSPATPAPGDSLQLRVGFSEEATPADRVEVVLRARIDAPGWEGQIERSRDVLYEASTMLEQLDELRAPGSDVELVMELPAGVRAPAHRKHSPLCWELDVRVTTRDVRFTERFPLEVAAEDPGADA